MKGIMVGLFGLFIFVNVLFMNVFAHEIGHYLAAKDYGLEPEIEYEFSNMTGAGFGFEGVPIAYTTFIDNGNYEEIIVVALMGSFFNILIGLFFMFLFIYFKNKIFIREIMLICIITSIGAGLMNLIPFSGSDGAMIWGLL
jgi:hypothetical protein